MQEEKGGDSVFERYAKLRDEKGLTDYRVSEDTGISKSTLSEWKAGKYEPKLDKIAALAAYFDVPIEYFVKGD
jgi:transcriptional regulator with XRE-family HTH domain